MSLRTIWILSTDALAEAINHFDGGMVLVSHDMRLISQVAEEVWNVEGGGVNVFKGDIGDYKDKLREIMSLPRSADKNFSGGKGETKTSSHSNKSKSAASAKPAASARPAQTAQKAPKNSRWRDGRSWRQEPCGSVIEFMVK